MPDASENKDKSSSDLTGQQLGDYAVIRRLGRGGMADVYLAEQSSLKRNVALKILKPSLATDQSYVQRFQREAQAVAALVQSNIVQIYEVGCEQGYYYIAQEYVRGRNLKQYLDRYGAVEPVMAINVLRQAALALQKAGELDVVHRDIKPENIMISTKGEVKITDFGLARVNRLDGKSEKALTQIGVTMGTPLYMSPEQVGGQALDHRSDIYSLGITAYHMLAGEPPYDGETALAIAVQHVNNPIPSLDSLRPDVPVPLVRVIKKMMEKKPDRRQQNADELLKELREIPYDAEENWEIIVEKLTAGPMGDSENVSTTLSQSRLAATRQLQQVMLGKQGNWWSQKWLLISIALIGVLGAVAGSLLATFTGDDPLLNVQEMLEDEFPKRASVVEQYRAADFLEPSALRLAGLEKVIEHFPYSEADREDRSEIMYYHRLTWLRMGEIYLEQLEFGRAEEVFLKLSQASDLWEGLQVAGYVGLAITYAKMPEEEIRGRSKTRNELVGDAISAVKRRERKLVSESMKNKNLLKQYREVYKSYMQIQAPSPATLNDQISN